MTKVFSILASCLLLFACSGEEPRKESATEGDSHLEVFDSREAERALYEDLGVSEVFGYLRIFPDTAQSDTSFLIRYEKIDSIGRKVRLAEYRIDGFMISNTAYQYDEQNRRVASSTIGPDGQLKSQNAFSYDVSGQPDKVLNRMGPEGESEMTIYFDYVLPERQVIQRMVSSEGKEVASFKFSLNEAGKFTVCDINRGGKVYEQHFTYGVDGKLVEDLMTSEEQVLARTKYLYQPDGLKKEKWLIGVGDTLEGIVEYRYNFGHLSQ